MSTTAEDERRRPGPAGATAEDERRPSGPPGATAKEERPRPVSPVEGPASWAREQLAALRELLGKPLTTYYLIIGCSALLLALGLMMVLSASSIEAMQKMGSPYYWFIKQSLSAAVGVPIMWACARLPHRFFRWAGYPLMALSIIALIMVLFIGSSELGAQRWIYLPGGLTIQPSEPAKLGLALWGADLLARRARQGRIEWRQMLIPLMPGTAILAVLVMLGRDLGTTLVLFMVFLALLWVVGAPLKLFGGILGLAVLAAATMILVEPYRLRRIGAFLDPWADAQGAGYQAVQGQIAMGSGGWFGLGLGSSRAKWSWLPHGESDFIFAILGEELGLMGTLVVVALFGLLGYAGLRVATRVNDAFVRLAASAVVAWIAGQAIVNMGAVLGVLPITGIPLPLVSYGGSALLPTMAALGMLLAFAKREPGAREALAARGPGPAVRALSWLGLGGMARGRARRR